MMKRRWIAAVVLMMLLLSACSAATPPPATEVGTPETNTVEAAPTLSPTDTMEATEAAAEPEAAPTAVEFTASAPATCTVVSLIGEPDPTQVAAFPPVTEDDWVFGPPDAMVTILEYSDFQ
jgi:hypothetical protein